jgi:hypothetical protein
MRLPDDTHVHAIYGQRGSGKTVGGLWALEKRSWLVNPWIIIDYKGDPTIGRIPRLEWIDVEANPPKRAGLYAVKPLPTTADKEKLETFLWKIWENEDTGLFVDEAHMLGMYNEPYNAILTQGRSKRCPVISLSQRPRKVSPYLLSEADFHQVFHIQRPQDWKAIQEVFPDLRDTRRDFHSQYYDTARGEVTYLRPVPKEDVILDRFDKKMPRRSGAKQFELRGFIKNVERKRRVLA